MAKKGSAAIAFANPAAAAPVPTATGRLPSARPSALFDTRVVYCGDNLEQLAKLLDTCVDLGNETGTGNETGK